MNKKIFTLFVAAFCGFGVANAQAVNMGAKHTTKLKQGGLYHIGSQTVAEGYIYPDANNNLILGTANELATGVWCVKASKPSSSTYPEFTFENKAQGISLGVDLAPYVTSGQTVYPAELTYSDVSTWRFSSTYQEGMDGTANYLMSYLPTTKDSVAVLTYDATATPRELYVEIIKAPAAGTIPTVSTGKTLFQGFLHDAAPIILNAAAFNTMFGATPNTVAKGFNFIAPTNAAIDNSPLKDKFVAEDVNLGTSEYLRLADKAAPSKYLRVDTTVYNVAGNPYLKFAYSKKAEYDALVTAASSLVEQHHFRLVYLPSADSMIINVEAVHKPIKGDDLTSFGAWATWNQESSNDPLLGIATGHNQTPASGVNDDKTYVTVQNLTNTTYCLTIGETPVQTHIGFGFTGCTVSDNRTTLEGLFVIKNTEGKYLQVPIYTDSVTSPVAKWVTLEKYVDPFQMPSFQWAVVKTRGIDPQNISTVTLTNREYNNVTSGSVQLFSDENTTILGASVNSKKGDKLDDAASFIEVPKAQRLDSTLGYKYVPEDITKLRTYTFNYLHELDHDTYLSVKNSEKDSLLYVQKDNADGFELVPYHHGYTAANGWSVAPVAYGVTLPAAWVNSGYAVQLKRTAYVLKIKEGNKIYNTNKVVVVDKEGRFAVTPGDNDAITVGDSAVFYLKTNNTIVSETGDVRNYYALVDTASFSNENTPNRITVKGGVADHNLWLKAQNHYEVRTSAFAVEPSVEPLYRRFNRTVDGVTNGATDFYNDVDSAFLHLRFHRVNNDREFLYEDANHPKYSAGKGINFLGYKHVADFGADDDIETLTTFRVDTAFVNRPAVPGAEFDTPKPQYLIGLGINDIVGGTYTPECEPSITTPSYSRGRYLINATDSVYGVGADWKSNVAFGANGVITSSVKNNKYIWDTKWERLAFVEGIRKGDTLYILNGAGVDYTGALTNDDFAKLRADKRVRAVALNNNLHKDVVFSFRLINTEKDAAYADQTQDFLIESETELRGEEPMIAPMKGGWVKLQNGVPVISRGFYEQAITDAERFNVKASTAAAVANEDVNAEAGVKVSAEAGVVRVQNAAGKTVTISNILGQTVASQTITSDDVTIAAPKGIVVVSVAGENAVKAVVR